MTEPDPKLGIDGQRMDAISHAVQAGIPKEEVTSTDEERKFYDLLVREKAIYDEEGIGLEPNYDLRQ